MADDHALRADDSPGGGVDLHVARDAPRSRRAASQQRSLLRRHLGCVLRRGSPRCRNLRRRRARRRLRGAGANASPPRTPIARRSARRPAPRPRVDRGPARAAVRHRRANARAPRRRGGSADDEACDEAAPPTTRRAPAQLVEVAHDRIAHATPPVTARTPRTSRSKRALSPLSARRPIAVSE